MPNSYQLKGPGGRDHPRFTKWSPREVKNLSCFAALVVGGRSQRRRL